MGIVETIEAGKIVQENRIERLRCAPEGYSKVHWKEELKEKNRENIYEAVKLTHPNALYIRQWDGDGYFSFLRIDGIDMVVDVSNDLVPIWNIKTIEQILENRNKRLKIYGCK